MSRKWKYPTHIGKNKVKIYGVWNEMCRRCNAPTCTSYNRYGARGITVCDDWLSYDNFYEWAMANGYKEGLTIDRVNNNGNYEPSNCRWVTQAEQNRNTRRNVYIDGKCISQIADEAGINATTVLCRYYKNPNISLEEISMPTEDYIKSHSRILINGLTLKEISKRYGISEDTLSSRYFSGVTDFEKLIIPVSKYSTKILVEGKSLKEIAEKYSLKERLVRSRYEKGARTIEELTRPFRKRRG